MTRTHITALEAYPWPDNIRELQNIIERALILSRSRVGFHLPELLTREVFTSKEPPAKAPDGWPILTNAQMKKRERDDILAVLEKCGWKVYGPQGVAELLEMKPTTLSSIIKALGLARRKFSDDTLPPG